MNPTAGWLTAGVTFVIFLVLYLLLPIDPNWLPVLALLVWIAYVVGRWVWLQRTGDIKSPLAHRAGNVFVAIGALMFVVGADAVNGLSWVGWVTVVPLLAFLVIATFVVRP